MILALDVHAVRRDDRLLTLDWESIGGLVRQRTLEALATHFAALGAECGASVDEAVGPLTCRDAARPVVPG